MIETSQWIVQLALRSGLSEETCERLWKLFLELITNRLMSGTATLVEQVFYLDTVKHTEYIALLPDGRRLLIPPRVQIIATTPKKSLSGVPLEQLLIESSDATAESVLLFYRALGAHFRHHLERGHTLSLRSLGIFEPLSTGNGFLFTPEKNLCDKVNKPFKAFVITPLPEGKSWSDVSECSVADEKELVLNVPLNVTWEEEVPLPTAENTPEEVDDLSEESPLSTPLTTPPPIPSEEIAPMASTLPPPIPEEIAGAQESEDTHSEEPMDTEAPIEVLPETPMKNRKKAFVYGTLVMVALLLIGGGWYYFYSSYSSSDPKRIARTVVKIAPEVVSEESDSIAPSEEITAPILGPLPDDRYIVIQKGDRLVDFARKNYGNKRFWVYIYLANRDVIKNPDNVPIGTRLRLPRVEEYSIDSQDSLSLHRADSLIRAYHNHKL